MLKNDAFREHLSKIHWHLTDYCLFSCPSCSANAGPSKLKTKFSSKDIEQVLDDAKTLGAHEFELSGGDPLMLSKDFILRSVNYAASKDFQTSVCTNGYALSQDRGYARELADLGLEKIKLSLHGTTPETHDAFTQFAGSHKKLINAIEYSKNAGIEVWLNATITPQNLEEMQGLSSFLNDFGVDVVQLSSIVPTGRGRFATDHRFTEDGLTQAIERLRANIPGLNEDIPDFEYRDDLPGLNYVFTIALFPYPENYPFPGRFCDYFVERLVIDPNGDVIPCCLLPQRLQHKLGNIQNLRLADIYSSRNVKMGSVFDWLTKGHKRMRTELGYDDTSHNLCSICSDMLFHLTRY